MVRVQLYRNECGQVLGFLASGHANRRRRDQEYDLVCAAISAVTQTAVLGLGQYVGLENRLTYSIDEDGWLQCRLPVDLSAEERIRTDAILETLLIGLKSIESEYPKQIRVEEEVE